jgi:dGTPase
MADHDLSREHPDPLAEGWPPLVLDRQRVIHCAAFRRLQHKTQVFVAPESDHFRTRLTHTLEVAHQARCLAELVGLDANLAEVVALAHDLGHPPFGHAGERALSERMAEHGGFEHNRHTLRIVEDLEHPYPEFAGLNLTRAVRQCLAGHSTPYDQPGAHPLHDAGSAPPESGAVDLADRLTYALHDLLDGLHAGLLEPVQLQDVQLWRWAYRGPHGGSADDWRPHLRPAIDRIQKRVLDDLARQARDAGCATAPLSVQIEGQLGELERFLVNHLYRSELLVRADEQAACMLTAVFDAYIEDADRLPPRFRKRIADRGLYRVVADYVAGMTDRFCMQEHARCLAS